MQTERLRLAVGAETGPAGAAAGGAFAPAPVRRTHLVQSRGSLTPSFSSAAR
jgi:hypothetical protein